MYFDIFQSFLFPDCILYNPWHSNIELRLCATTSKYFRNSERKVVTTIISVFFTRFIFIKLVRNIFSHFSTFFLSLRPFIFLCLFLFLFLFLFNFLLAN